MLHHPIFLHVQISANDLQIWTEIYHLKSGEVQKQLK